MDKDVIIIQDSGSNSDYNKNDYVDLKLIETDFKADRLNFKNYYELKNYDCLNGADKIVLAGALYFKLKEY